MTLGYGEYHIHTMDGAPVGRSDHEDKSLNPKAIYRLRPHIEPPKWTIHRGSGHQYKISIGGGVATDIGGKLFAVLHEHHTPEEWLIKRHDQHGPDVFTIEAPENGNGWVVPHEYELEGEHLAQIEVRTLIIHPTHPPRYPPYELFRINRVMD